MKELTKAEEEIMQVLWKLKKAFVKDVIEVLPKPKPAYNTVSTIIRILERKGFVGYTACGKTHEYFPLVDKDEYRRFALKRLMKTYFSNSFENMVSFFAKENDISLKEINEIIKQVEKSKKQRK